MKIGAPGLPNILILYDLRPYTPVYISTSVEKYLAPGGVYPLWRGLLWGVLLKGGFPHVLCIT